MRIAPLKNGVYKIDLKYRFLILNHFLYQLYTCQKKTHLTVGFFLARIKLDSAVLQTAMLIYF